MGPDYWKKAWREGRTRFHQKDVNHRLRSFFPRLNLKAGDDLFVPLCGKSLDMLWARDQGVHVIGVEVSHEAVEAFFDENNLERTTGRSKSHVVHRANGITIYEGDYYRIGSSLTRSVKGVYDRAAHIALPPDERIRYARRMAQLIPPGARMLLLTIEHAGTDSPGPPFSIPLDEVESLYGSAFDVECLVDEDILSQSRMFQDRRASMLLERVFLLQRMSSE